MDPLDAAVPGPNDPVPPPYEAEYDRKLSDAIQRSLQLAHPPPSPNNHLWQIWDDDHFRAAQAQRLGVRASLPPPPSPSSNSTDLHNRPGSSASHRRQNSISSNGTSSSAASGSASRSTKERPSWYNDAGLGRPGSSGPSPRFLNTPARQSYASGSSSQNTSPTDDTPPRLFYPSSNTSTNRVLDEEAGIDNPPPPFAATAATASPNTPAIATQHPSRTSTVYSQSPLSYTSTATPRSSYESAPPPRVRDPSLPIDYARNNTSSNLQQQQQARSTTGRRRTGSMSFNNGSTEGMPTLAFDKNLAYGGGRGGLPPGAAQPGNATAFYSSAVSAVLMSSAQPNSNNPNPYASYFTQQRQPTQPAYPSMNSTTSPPSTNSGYSYAQQQQLLQQPAQTRRPSSAQGAGGYPTTNSHPQSQTQSLSQRPVPQRQPSREGLQYVRSPSRSSTASATTPVPSRPPSAPGPRAAPYQPSYPTNGPSPYASYITTSTISNAMMAPQQKRQSTTTMSYPGNVGAVTTGASGADRWVPPGAAAPANVYGRRFA